MEFIFGETYRYKIEVYAEDPTVMGTYYLTVSVAPAQPVQIVSEWGGDILVCDRDSYSLEVEATGSVLDYTWYKDGIEVSGESSEILNITINEPGEYKVRVNGELDTISSGPATVRFSQLPVITKNPQDTSIIGSPVMLTVEATGLGLEYQWYFNNKLISGSVTESLKVRDEGNYHVQITNACGSILSATAHVTCQVQIVSEWGGDILVCDRDSYSLKVKATGSVLDYTWYKDGIEVSGESSETLNITINEPGEYKVRVNGELDTISSGPATVRFSQLPVITKNPQDTSIIGSPVMLTVEATGLGLEYQWYFNNKLISGSVTESLKVRDEGNYHVQITNECGSILSATAHVTYQLVEPIINRRVDMPQVEGVVTTPSAATHYVESRTDFIFYMSAAEGYTLDEVTVSTNRGNEVLMELTDDGRVKVTIKRVNAVITIRIEGVKKGISSSPQVRIPQIEGIQTDPPSGLYLVKNNQFTFDMWANEGYSIDGVKVTIDSTPAPNSSLLHGETTRADEETQITIEPTNIAGRLRVTIKGIIETIYLRIEGFYPVSNLVVPAGSRVWSDKGKIYFFLSPPADVFVYTQNGRLHEQRRLPEGESILPMPAGVYFIRLTNGTQTKLIVP